MTARERSRAPWPSLAVAGVCVVLALVYRSGAWALAALTWAFIAAVSLPRHELPAPAPPERRLDPVLCGADVLGFACTRPAGHTRGHVSAARELAELVESCYGADQATVDGLVAECAETAELTDAEVDRLRWALGDPDITDDPESRI